MLRRQFLSEMAKRFDRVRRAIWQAVGVDDILGLRDPAPLVGNVLTVNDNPGFQFLTDAEKVPAFQAWLKELVDTELLSADTPAAPWTDKYIGSAYKQGLKRGFFDAKPGLRTRTTAPDGGGNYEAFLDAAFGSNEDTRKLKLLGTRAFTNLKGVTAAMDQQLSNTLVQGLAEGRAPGAIAKQMVEQVDTLTKTRAAAIARTEVIHAHAEGQLDGFDDAGLQEVVVFAEWATAGDDRVCSRCAPLQGVVFTIEEARGMIPRHPNCRCAWLPAAVGEQSTGQVWGNRRSPLLDSMKAETGLTDGAAARAKSTWRGSDKFLPSSIAKQKPKMSALQEANAAAKAAKGTAAKLDKAKGAIEQAARQRVKKKALANVQAAQSKLAKAGIPSRPTDFAGGELSDALVARILNDPLTGKLLLDGEELIATLAEAKATGTPLQQAGYLLRKRAAIFDAQKQAAKALKRAGQAKALKQAAIDATKAVTGLTDAAFTAEGMLDAGSLAGLADTLDLTAAQVAAINAATTATEQAAVLGQVVPEAKAATQAALKAFVQKYNAVPGLFENPINLADDVLDLKYKMLQDSFGGTPYHKEWFAWSADKLGGVFETKNPAAQIKAFEKVVDAYKYEIATKEAAARAAALDDFASALAAKGAGVKSYAELKAAVSGATHPGTNLLYALDPLKATAGINHAKLADLVVRAESAGAKVVKKELKYSSLHTLKTTFEPKAVLEAAKAEAWNKPLKVVKFKGKFIVIEGDEAVQAAKWAQIKGSKGIPVTDLDKWLKDKTAAGGNWALTGATKPKAHVLKSLDAAADPGLTLKLGQSPLNEAPPDVALSFMDAVAQAKAAGTQATEAAVDIDDLHTFGTKYLTDKAKAAVEQAEQAISTNPYANPWAGVGVTKFEGTLYVTQGLDVATAAQVSGVKKVIVALTDLDAVAAAKPPVVPSLTLPEFAKIKVLKSLPGSTNPQLVESTVDGTRWVMKAGLDPGHVRSEVLADQLYKQAGFAVPEAGIVETTGGPVKFAQYLEGGTTLNKWLTTAAPLEREVMMQQIRKGFVMDALMANHDVGGLTMDNIFVVGKKAYRIDNGGALLYRAQGAAKADFKAVVKELDSMRKASVNSVTAELYRGITDGEIHDQIRAIVQQRESLLQLIPDADLRKVMGERIDWLSAQLPAPVVDTTRAVHLQASKTPAIYNIDNAAIERIKKSRVNGVTLAGDKDLIEDNNLIVWQEADRSGKEITRMAFKVTKDGSQVLVDALPSTGVAPAAKAASAAALPHPEDVYWAAFENAAKTVSTHAKDGNYNMGTLAAYDKAKAQLTTALSSGTTDQTKASMLKFYEQMAEDIENAKATGTVTVKRTQWELPAQAAPVRPTRDTYRVTTRDLGDRVANIQKGRATSETTKQTFSISGKGHKQVFHVDTGEGVVLDFVPSSGDTGGNAWGGRVSVTVEGPVTQETIDKARAVMKTLGVDIAPPTPAQEEALYIHKTIYLRGEHTKPSYSKIWNDKTITPEEKVTKLKAWVHKEIGIKLPDVPTEDYNPAGTAMDRYGNGARVWDRWDTPRAVARAELDTYRLTHTTESLYNSPRGAVGRLVPRLLDSGGELTSTMSRVRKGVAIYNKSSAEADMGTGGADYIFTRLQTEAHSRQIAGLMFKPEVAARVDGIHYKGDRFGNIENLYERSKNLAESKGFANNDSNEFIFKHGLSIIDDILEIRVHDEAEKRVVVEAYKAAGFERLPDGRLVADIVTVF